MFIYRKLSILVFWFFSFSTIQRIEQKIGTWKVISRKFPTSAYHWYRLQNTGINLSIKFPNRIFYLDHCELWCLDTIMLLGAGSIKVRKFQNENMESSHCPKYEQKIWKILPWTLRAEIFNFFYSYFRQCDDIIFSFWNLLTFKGLSFDHISLINGILLYILSCACTHMH